MLAAILREIGKIDVIDKPVPSCNNGEVLIKVEACGICRTDLKAYRYGQRDLQLPRILGHEISGQVVELGQGVLGVQEGDRVQVSPGIPCGTCDYCLQGSTQMCNNISIMGFHLDGGFSEYLVIPKQGVSQGILNLIPETLSFKVATLAEPLACSINMQEKLDINKGDSVLIFGAGPLGLINAKLARERGAETIIIVESNEKRLNRVLKETSYPDNNTYLVHPNRPNFQKEIMAITGKFGVDVVVPCCSDVEAFNQGLSLLKKQGKFGFFSGLGFISSTKIDLNLVHYKELKVFGAYGCATIHNKKAIDLMAHGKLNLESIITKTVSLSEVEDALLMIENLTEQKVVLDLSK